METPNLELTINNQPWKVIIRNEPGKSYYETNTKDKILYVNNYNIDAAKNNAWVTYHEEQNQFRYSSNK